MVKVRSMKKAKRTLLIASMLVVGLNTASASVWKHRTADKPEASAAAASPAGMSLTAVDLETTPSPRLILRTTGTPAYTSYSPAPDVFVVDLTGTSKGTALSLPSPLPPGVNSVTADDVVEMGNRLTRVTVRLAAPAAMQASAGDNSVVLMLPAPAIAAAPADSQPAVAQTASAPAPTQADAVPVVADDAVKPLPVVEPSVKAEPLAEPPARSSAASANLPKAKTLKGVDTTGSGAAIEVQLAADGDVAAYKAFRLDNPARLVIDLSGLRNAVAGKAIEVSDPVVKRIRVAQFKGAPDPVTRVVVDLAEKTEYHILKDGDHLRVSFGGNMPTAAAHIAAAPPATQVASAPAVAPPAAPAAEPPAATMTVTETKSAKVAPAAADVPSQVPTVAENATSWNVPEKPTKHATTMKPSSAPRHVINQSEPTTPPRRPRRTGTSTTTTSTAPATVTPTPAGEDVFTDAAAGPQVGNATDNANAMANNAANANPNGYSTRNLSGSGKVYTGEPLSLRLKDADIKDVLRTFAELTGLNIAVDPQVTGSVTVDFVDVPWDQALDIILRQNGLTYVLEGNVMRVGTVNRLAEEANNTRALAEQEKLNVPLRTVSKKLSYARATDVRELLKDVASPRARILVDGRTNQIIISEIPAYLDTMLNLIESVDVPTRQVVIEARIVETSKTFLQQWGFNIGFGGRLDPALGTGTGLVFPNRIDFATGTGLQLAAGKPILGVSLANVLGTFTLDLALSAAESEGLAKVISAPRITTQDNVAAEVQSGFQLPFQTRINFTTTVQYVDATLRLSVTPQITEAGTVIMDISIQKVEPAVGLSVEGNTGTPLTTRNAKTRLMVRDGGTSVIAGIYQTKDNNGQSRIPFLHQIPVLGNLFKSRDINASHDELLIFITPRIVRSS